MHHRDSAIAIFPDHADKDVAGSHNADDQLMSCDGRGAMQGTLWGLFFGGVFITVPIIGSEVIRGSLETAAISVIVSALVVGGVSVLVAAIYGIGMRDASVLQYEPDLAEHDSLALAHGTPGKIAARAVKACVDRRAHVQS